MQRVTFCLAAWSVTYVSGGVTFWLLLLLCEGG